MKNMKLFSILLILFFTVSTVVTGQYTGTNPNVASSKLVVASDSVAGYEPGKAVDNSLVGYCAIPGTAPAWIQIDLGKYHYIDGYGMVLPNAGDLPKEYTFQASQDGANWTDLGSETITLDGSYSYDVVSPDPIRYVRINMTDKDTWASFAEIYVYGIEMQKPVPPVSYPATNITTTGFTASWSERTDAAGYVITVAKDAGFADLVPGYAKWVGLSIAWDVTDLSPGTSYYYKVRAYNLAGTSYYGNAVTVTTAKSAQTIVFDSPGASTYGDPDFELAASASSGLPVSYTSSNENVATVLGTIVTITGIGTTSITASQAGNSQYFAATPVVRDLVVSKKELLVTDAVAENKEYDGTADAIVSGATLTGVVGTDEVSLTGADAGVFAQSNVGTGIAVSVSMEITGADIGYYSLVAPADLTADITAKELLVTADDKTREECESNPEFTITYSGFVGSEDAGVLDPEPVATCSADAGSPDGKYDITLSEGSATNYILTLISGTLTVTPDVIPPSLVVKNINLQVEKGSYALIKAADVVTSADDNCGIADTTLSQYLFTESDIGGVNVDVTARDLSGNNTVETAVVTVLVATGLEESAGLRARVFPNPTFGSVQLDMNGLADELKVMDITGKTIIRKANPGNDDVIDLSGFQSGIYIFHLRFGDDVLYLKVVKK